MALNNNNNNNNNNNRICTAQVCQMTSKALYIGVTTSTFCGDMTSSVTWPSDSPYAVSYRWSITIIRLSMHCIALDRQIWQVAINSFVKITGATIFDFAFRQI